MAKKVNSLIGTSTKDGKVIVAIYDKNPDNRYNDAWLATFSSLNEKGKLVFQPVSDAWNPEANCCGILTAYLTDGTYFGHFRPDSRCEKSILWFGQWKDGKMIELDEETIINAISNHER